MPRLRVPFPQRKVRAPDILPAVKEYVRRRQEAIGAGGFTYQLEKDIGRSRADYSSHIGDRWEGFEIKSETDSLSRLRTQVDDYSRHFDRCWIVAHSKHFPLVYDRVPEWWGVMEVWAEKGDVVLELRRGPGKNPNLDPYAMLKLLWKDELLELAAKKGLKVKRRWTKGLILLKLRDVVELEEAKWLLKNRIVLRPATRRSM